MQGQRSAQVKVEDGQDLDLHLEDLPLGVSSVGDVDKVLDLWCIDLLILGSNQHGSHSNQLELAPRHTALANLNLEKSKEEDVSFR